MRISPYDNVYALNQAASLSDLLKAFERIAASYGFDLFAIQYRPAAPAKAENQPYILGNYTQEWLETYHLQQTDKLHSDLLDREQKRQPFVWSTSQDKRETAGLGICAGADLPLLLPGNEPCVATFISTACALKEVEQILKESHMELAFLAVSFQQAVHRLLEKEALPTAPSLTSREKECLTWAASGKTDAEIGMILQISHRTVNAHMANAYQKLDCVSREQAVVRALMMRLILV